MSTDLEGVAGAYPQVELRSTPDAVWLLNWVTPLPGLDESALLVTAYPLNRSQNIVSWAWASLVLIWIGPRHTNFPEGSICSFEPKDRTWQRGRSLITLLDLNVLWIVRHIFLHWFGRWPGRQIFHTEWERLNEHLPGELCGGCDSGRLYDKCCRPRDEAIDPIDRLMLYMKWTNGQWERRPPNAVSEYVYGCRKTPPALRDLGLRPRSGMSKYFPNPRSS